MSTGSVVATKPDYEGLRAILGAEAGEEVSLEYATGVGDFLVSVYETLLSDDEVVG